MAKVLGVPLLPLSPPRVTICYHCNEIVEDGIGCTVCSEWAHRKCVYVSAVPKKDINKLNWVCAVCLKRCKDSYSEEATYKVKFEEFKKSTEANFDELKESMNTRFDTLMALVRDLLGKDMQDQFVEIKSKLGKLDDVGKDVSEVVSAVEDLSGGKPGVSVEAGDSRPWVEVVKRKRRKKNILVVKGAAENQKAVENKDVVSHALEGVQIQDVRITNEGNMVMNFEDENSRSQAVAKLNAVSTVKTKEVGKRMPKIMICNVHKIESEDELIKTMIDRNPCLQNVDDVENKITLLKSKPAVGGTVHHILKCDPQVRGLLHQHQDKVKLQWGVYTLRDRYHALICYHCLRYGHIAAKCNHKEESVYCYRCGGLHSGKDCNSDVKKCINCMRQKKECTDHSANDGCCPILRNELIKIRDSTDHGF